MLSLTWGPHHLLPANNTPPFSTWASRRLSELFELNNSPHKLTRRRRRCILDDDHCWRWWADAPGKKTATHLQTHTSLFFSFISSLCTCVSLVIRISFPRIRCCKRNRRWLKTFMGYYRLWRGIYLREKRFNQFPAVAFWIPYPIAADPSTPFYSCLW